MNKIILYIDSMQKGGAQRVMSNLAQHYIEMGKQVILVNDIKPIRGIPEYDLNPGIKRIFLDKRFSENKIKKNIDRIKVLRRVLEEEKADCIISFVGPPNIRMLLASIGLKTKKIVSVRNDPNIEYGSGIKKYISKLVFLLADGCVFQTEDAADYFFRHTQKISRIILNPVNIKFFNQERFDIKKEIAVVGRLELQKNNKLAIKAFSQIINTYSDYKLIFYGEGSLLEELKCYADNLNVSKYINFYGLCDDIEKKLAQSAIFLMTSDYEGMPNVVMEAMAIGVPVIVTDCPCGGPRSLIQKSEQGILVPCNDVDSIKSALIKIISDDKLRERYGKEAKARAEDFRPIKVFKQWDDYLEEISKL